MLALVLHSRTYRFSLRQPPYENWVKFRGSEGAARWRSDVPKHDFKDCGRKDRSILEQQQARIWTKKELLPRCKAFKSAEGRSDRSACYRMLSSLRKGRFNARFTCAMDLWYSCKTFVVMSDVEFAAMGRRSWCELEKGPKTKHRHTRLHRPLEGR